MDLLNKIKQHPCFALMGSGALILLILYLSPYKNSVAVIFPYLLFAACPLSMMFMMRKKDGGHSCCSKKPEEKTQDRSHGQSSKLKNNKCH